MLTRTPPHMFNETIELSPNPNSPCSPGSPDAGASQKTDPPKRLRYWLIDMINSGEIEGLKWVDENLKIFRVPWKHAGKNNWKEEDCKIFQAWAEHRGKFKKGETIDPAKWKTRLRCALNKVGDIQQLNHLSCLDGDNPYRVYQLVEKKPDEAQEARMQSTRRVPEPREHWLRGRPSHQNDPEHTNFPDYQQQQNIQMLSAITLSQSQQHSQIMINNSATTDQPHQYLKAMPRQEYNPVNQHQHYPPVSQYPIVSRPNHQMYPYNQASNPMPSIGYNQEQSNYTDPNGFHQAPLRPTVNQFHQDLAQQQPVYCDRRPEYFEMDVFIFYRGKKVKTETVSVPAGCRIYYGNVDQQLHAMRTVPSVVFGSHVLHQIGLVDCERYSVCPKQANYTQHILNNIKRGLVLSYENHCFYAQRLCQSRVFIFGPESSQDTPEKLARNTKVKIFDYSRFASELEKYIKDGRSKLPEIKIKASFGQNWSIKTPIEKNLVTLCMIPRVAKYFIKKTEEHNNLLKSSQFNDSILDAAAPDSFDRLAENATNTNFDLSGNTMQLLDDIDMSLLTAFDSPGNAQFAAPSLHSGPLYPTDGIMHNKLHIEPISNDIEML